MDLHKTLLQAELTRIEREAEAKSFAVMNRADDLERAHRLCVLLNTGDDIYPPLQPYVRYEGVTQTCRVVIHAGESGCALLVHADALKLGWSSENGQDDAYDVRIDNYGPIEVVVDKAQLRAYLDYVEAAAA